MDIRDDVPIRSAGFFMADDGMGMDDGGRALPCGPSEARVRLRPASMSCYVEFVLTRQER